MHGVCPSRLRGIESRVVELLIMSPRRLQRVWFLMREAWPGLLAASVVSFEGARGELGIALMLGNDIRYKTRVLTTAVAHETMLGEFGTRQYSWASCY